MSERLIPQQFLQNKRKLSWDHQEQKHSIAASLDTKKKIDTARQIVTVNIVTQRQQDCYRKKIQQIEQGILENYDQLQQLLERSKETQISKKKFLDQMNQAKDMYREALKKDKMIRSQIQKVGRDSNQQKYLLQKLDRHGNKINDMKRNYQECRQSSETNNLYLKMFLQNIRRNVEYLQQKNRRLDQYQDILAFGNRTADKSQ